MRAVCEDVKMVFINIDAPAVGVERVVFLHVLNEVIDKCNNEEYVFMGGGCNSTEDSRSDRNHAEPHAASHTRLLHLMEAQELCDVWRDKTPGHKEQVLLYSTFKGSIAWYVFGTLKWFYIEPFQRVHLKESLGFFVARQNGSI